MPVRKPTDEIERRFVEIEARAVGDGDLVIEGQGAIFGQEADLGYFVEVVERGFFDDVLEDPEIVGLWNHNHDVVLGRSGNNTLELTQNDSGLDYRIHINPDDGEAMSKYAKVKRGDVHRSSFAFTVKSKSRGDDIDGDEWFLVGDKVIRRLKAGGCRKLYDVSPVAFAAYPTTSANARSMADAMLKQEANDEANPDGQAPTPDEATEKAEAQARRRARLRALEIAESAYPQFTRSEK
jgi:uncharacterized protein